MNTLLDVESVSAIQHDDVKAWQYKYYVNEQNKDIS